MGSFNDCIDQILDKLQELGVTVSSYDTEIGVYKGEFTAGPITIPLEKHGAIWYVNYYQTRINYKAFQ